MAQTSTPSADADAQAGFFDLQINGYAGVDFNGDELTADDLHRACQALADEGASAFLPTIVTEQIERMEQRLRRLVELREQDPLAERMIPGIHIEGPFINPEDGYRGAHPADAVRPGDADLAERLVDAAGGLARVFTLAPECDPDLGATRRLADRGLTVSAGHCNPSMDQLKAAADAGLGMFTHLGNGCPMHMHRHDNIIQRVLSLSDRLMICFIADGVHIPWPALGNYFRCVPADRRIVTTDAMSAAGLGPGRYRLGRWEVVVGEDRGVWAPDGSHLVGSAVGLKGAADNLRRQYELNEPAIDQLMNENPRRAAGVATPMTPTD